MRGRAYGRIVSWEGASLWILATRPGEIYPRTIPHAHHALQVTLALHGTVNLRTDGDAYAGTAAAVASDERMALRQSMQADIADDAQDGEQIVIEGSHNLQVFHAREVADEIRAVLP